MRATLAVLIVCVPLAAQAKPERHTAQEFNGDRWVSVAGAGASNQVARAQTARSRKAHPRGWKRQRRHIPAPGEVRPIATVIGGRPAGCPRRYCGCGTSLYLFGRIIPSLNLAANWLRFPRAAAAPGMVAARRGHVFALKSHISGSTWLVHDSNSGGGRTRIHARSIAGYVIVNPRGGA